MQFSIEPAWLAALVGAVVVLVIGAVGWMQRRSGRREGLDDAQAALRAVEAERERERQLSEDLRARLRQAEAQHTALRERLDDASDRRAAAEARLVRLPEIEKDLRATEDALQRQRSEWVELKARSEEQLRAAEQRLALLSTAEERLSEQFRSLAQQIVEERTKQFDEQSRKQIGGMLEPLREQIRGFSDVMLQQQTHAQRERATLNQEIQSLKQLNQRISEDAINLTRALKGDSKTQGVWGEMVLERVLEASGLAKGREYEVQVHVADEDGGRARPDVIVRLPDDKDLVVDSKVSLTAYERFVRAEDDASRDVAMRDHLVSLRRHMEELGRRDYAGMEGVRSVDFVLMFVPVEAAFIEAVRADGGLYEHALRHNVALVSPSTLLATLRTVAHLWRIEHRNVNAAEIARRGAMLYDSFALLVDEIEQVGAQLEKAQKAQSSAMRRLTEGGRGSVVLQVEHLRQLGAVGRKQLPRGLLDRAGADPDGAADATPAVEPDEGRGGAEVGDDR